MSIRSPIGMVLVALATLVVAGGTLVLTVLRAEPAVASASCVAVVVDFRQLGGALQTRCVQGDPATGLQALRRAGFSSTPRARDGLICQIDTRPACTDTTSSTYWSYWYRSPGSSRWVYANEGAGTHDPKPGSTEAWVWQVGGRTPPPPIRADAICPQLAATSTPKPTHEKPSTKPTSKPSKTQTSSAPPARPTSATSSQAGRRSASPSASPVSSAPPTSSLSPLAAARPSEGGTTGGSASGPTQDGDSGGVLGGPAGAALGGLVVLGIGAATFVRARHGRST